jgi:hypothetical protein
MLDLKKNLSVFWDKLVYKLWKILQKLQSQWMYAIIFTIVGRYDNETTNTEQNYTCLVSIKFGFINKG